MIDKNEKGRSIAEQPGNMDSFNNQRDNRNGGTEDVQEKKDETQSYQDYNGNSEENAPARTRE